VRFDLACAAFFTLNWIIWFWLAKDRLNYVCSFDTLVDFVTIAPSVILYIMTRINTGADRLVFTGITVLRVFRWVVGFRVWGLGFRVWGLGFMV
jgi:hypothetical protein